MLDSHYAPEKTLKALPNLIRELSALPETGAEELGFLLMSGDEKQARQIIARLTPKDYTLRILSEKGDWREAAQNLFAHLRALDESQAKIIFCEPCSEQVGIGYAVADRLRRAITK
jgi:L-threonylcarbamoyladenylate synthase